MGRGHCQDVEGTESQADHLFGHGVGNNWILWWTTYNTFIHLVEWSLVPAITVDLKVWTPWARSNPSQRHPHLWCGVDHDAVEGCDHTLIGAQITHKLVILTFDLCRVRPLTLDCYCAIRSNCLWYLLKLIWSALGIPEPISHGTSAGRFF